MKKYIYICCLILLGMNGWAQININDGWGLILNEQFTGIGRGWGEDYNETRITYLNTNPVQSFKWCANCIELADGVTGEGRFQAFQKTNVLFNNGIFSDNKLRLVSEFISNTSLLCDGTRPTGYEIPVNSWQHCTSEQDKKVFYYSGNIQSNTKCFHFGYYEVECSLPVHNGAHACFWLWGCYETPTDSIYEEIDVVEYSVLDRDNDTYYGYSTGVWYNEQSSRQINNSHHLGYSPTHIPQTNPDITQMHTYGCEWMPDHITFYRDGEVTSELRDKRIIPQHEKFLKVSYSIDKFALKDDYTKPDWIGQDTLTINQIKVYQLATDCSSDVLIQSALQLNQLNSMKHSITINNSSGIVLSSHTNKTLRASDHILIEGPFELNAGAELTLMVHECPN